MHSLGAFLTVIRVTTELVKKPLYVITYYATDSSNAMFGLKRKIIFVKEPTVS